MKSLHALIKKWYTLNRKKAVAGLKIILYNILNTSLICSKIHNFDSVNNNEGGRYYVVFDRQFRKRTYMHLTPLKTNKYSLSRRLELAIILSNG